MICSQCGIVTMRSRRAEEWTVIGSYAVVQWCGI